MFGMAEIVYSIGSETTGSNTGGGRLSARAVRNGYLGYGIFLAKGLLYGARETALQLRDQSLEVHQVGRYPKPARRSPQAMERAERNAARGIACLLFSPVARSADAGAHLHRR